MNKIVVTEPHDFTEEQKQRLDDLGSVTYYDTPPSSPEEYLRRIGDADVICSGRNGLQDTYPQLKDIYIAVAFVSTAFMQLDVLQHNNVTVSNTPGINRHAVSEWVMAMIILLMRDLPRAINTHQTLREDGALPSVTPGLAGKKITVLGRGNVGQRVQELATVFGMTVATYTRDDNLLESISDADVVVDTLSSNSSTLQLLDDSFFNAMKQGSYFISVTRPEITDEDAMLRALDSGRLCGIASDCGGAFVGDTEDPLYQKLLDHPKVLVTPHIAYNSEMSRQMGNDHMIDNVEAWLNGKPQNIVT